MKLLLDENCQNLKGPLEKLGWTVEVAPEVIKFEDGEKSVKDSQILTYAQDKKMIIITYDKNLKKRCTDEEIPYRDPSTPGYQANWLDGELKKMKSWKDFL